MRFGIIQIRQYKQGKTKVKKKLLEQIAFGIFFIIILGLIIYSINGLLFSWVKFFSYYLKYRSRVSFPIILIAFGIF